MKRCVLLLLLTSWSCILAAQTTFCEAKEMAEQQQRYQGLAEQLIQQKVDLLQPYRNSEDPYLQQARIFYGGKLGEAIIDNTLRFLANPFALSIQHPIDYTSFKSLIEGNIAKDHQIIYPFLDDSEKAILIPTDFRRNGALLNPYYFYHQSDQRFYDETDAPIALWQPGHLYENGYEFKPTVDEELFALYNPATGEFHPLYNDFFTKVPFAKWSPIDGNIYLTDDLKPLTKVYDYQDNTIYQTNTQILLLFQNKQTKENRIAVLGTNYIGGGNESFDDFNKVITTSPTRLQNDFSIPTISKSLPSVVVDALAQFLVQRTKEELTLAFFDQFRNEVSASNEFQTLLPKTNFLLLTQEDVFRIPSMGAVWVESFQSDIHHLLPNLERLLLTDTTYQSLTEKPATKAFRLAYHLVDLSLKGEKPLNTLAILQEQFIGDTTNDGLKEVFSLLNILGNEFKNCELGQEDDLLSPRDLQTMSALQKKYFTALLYRKNIAAFLPLQEQFYDDFLIVLDREYQQILLTFAQFLGVLENLEAASQQYNLKGWNQDVLLDASQTFDIIAQSTIHLIELGFKLKYITNSEAYYQSTFYQEYYPIVLNTINAIGHVERQEYGVFLINLAQILEPIIADKFNPINGDQPKEITKFIKDFLFYGGFMVDILSAQEAADISAIIQQYAMPIGSFRLKRNASFTIDINAFPGLYMGIESGLKSAIEGSGVLGVTAPIGLAASWGDLNQEKQSFSLFFPIIDIGAAFSYRWGNEAGGFPDNLKWRQILSPGVHGVYGFKNLPISIMVGAQFLPKLRSISADDLNVASSQSVWHFGVSGVVDIPLFNIHVDENR